MTRYRATVSYDGTGFEGFQRQAEGHRTVQGELEAALTRIGWRGKAISAAGRTDSGVHAVGQVIAFDWQWRHGETALLRALNANLPPDVAVLDLRTVAPEFHPRFSARSRRYRYSIYNSPVRQPLRDRFSWRVWPEMSLAPLEAAVASLVGEHDFASFGTAPEPGGHTVRRVLNARWARFPAGRETGGLLSRGSPVRASEGRREWGDGWCFQIEAGAFLYRMVRSLVGTLTQVALGTLSPEEFRAILNAKRRDASGPVAPACGLCLMEVKY